MLNYISQLPSEQFALTWPRRVVVLGSTGSIGKSALSVMAAMPGHFEITGLACGRNFALLAAQALRLRPKFLAVQDAESAKGLEKALDDLAGYRPTVLVGQEGYAKLASLKEADLVLSGQSGAAGLWGTYAAVRAGKVVALANKESLVLAGEIIRKACRESGAVLLPMDSEHNAIFQCLIGQNGAGLGNWSGPNIIPGLPEDAPRPRTALKRVILTASGGPFLGRGADDLKKVSKAEALAHPTWNMGSKITIDSATMMNKGLEFVEACHLFGLGPNQVEVLVHPQSIVHSIIEYQDNSRLAQLGVPDMRIPISCCLGWPYRLRSGADELDLSAQSLTFHKPDGETFPALRYWQEAYAGGRGLTVTLNASNEVAVALFLEERIGFMDIPALCRRVMERWNESEAPQSIEDVLGMDAKARALALEEVKNL